MNIHEFCTFGLSIFLLRKPGATFSGNGKKRKNHADKEVSLKKRPASKQENEEDPKRTKLTEENITIRQALLKNEHSDPKKVGELIKLLPPGEQQLLWKKFEKSRLSAYKEGSQEKKHVLLRNWVIDGGQLAALQESHAEL